LKSQIKLELGEYKEIRIQGNQAVEVDTGAVIPENTTAVVKVEETKYEHGKVKIERRLNFGENIGWVGSDIPKVFEILRKGEIINAGKIALLASVGIDKVKVYKKPKIFVMTTGDELVAPGKPLEKGKIYESNAYYLLAKLKAEGYEVLGFAHVKDNKEEISQSLKFYLDSIRCDYKSVLIISQFRSWL